MFVSLTTSMNVLPYASKVQINPTTMGTVSILALGIMIEGALGSVASGSVGGSQWLVALLSSHT